LYGLEFRTRSLPAIGFYGVGSVRSGHGEIMSIISSLAECSTGCYGLFQLTLGQAHPKYCLEYMTFSYVRWLVRGSLELVMRSWKAVMYPINALASRRDRIPIGRQTIQEQ